MLRRTRAEAKAAGLVHYFTGKPCPQGHIVPRFVKSKVCMECSRSRVRDARKRDPLEFARWRAANLEHDRAQSRAWQQAHPVERRILVAERTAARKQRTPRWADAQLARCFYELASIATACTGFVFHVDHELPLRGELVSGLHVGQNLTVTLAEANLQKGNRWQP